MNFLFASLNVVFKYTFRKNLVLFESQKIFTDQHLRFNAYIYIYIWKKLYLGRKNEEAYPSPFVISVRTFYFPLAIESSSYRDSANRNLSEEKFRSKFSLVTICLQTDFPVTFAISIEMYRK